MVEAVFENTDAIFKETDLTLDEMEIKASAWPSRDISPFDREWPETQVERLRRLWVEGHSTAEIGRRMNTTKNAVVGKAHRLDLPDRPSPIRRLAPGQEHAKKKRPPYVPVKNTLPKLPSEAGQVVVLFEAPIAVPRTPTQRVRPSRAIRAPGGTKHVSPIDNLTPRPVRREEPKEKPYGRRVECQWPIGEPGSRDFRFCCEESEPGCSYCESHCKVAYVHIRDRREDAFA